MSHRWPGALAGAAGRLLLLFLLVPLGGLLVRAAITHPGAGLASPAVWPALRLSLFTTTCSTVCVAVLGTALAWRIARGQGAWARWAETASQLPVVIPPAVAGVAMLLVFGRRGVFGPLLDRAGIALPFTTAAVVMAEIFVSAPFFLQAATAAFRRIDEPMLIVARTLGASPPRVFFRIALPLALPGLWGGVAMSWARALGEFGATLMFAGNMPGRTQTLPLAIYSALESDLDAAQAIAALMVVIAFLVLLVLRALQPGTVTGGGAAR